MGLAEVRLHCETGGFEGDPLALVGQRRNGKSLLAIEADERSIHQLANIHHIGYAIGASAAALPDLGASRSRQYGLNRSA
jgi:hypothetical protein